MIARNAAASVIQVVVSAIVMFVLYRHIIQTLGAQGLGVWSIVLATASASRVGEFGMGASVTRFVAKYQERVEAKRAGQVVQTAIVSVTVIFGILIVPLYYALGEVLIKIVPLEAIDQALELLPYALLSLLLSSIAGVFQAGLDGCQRYDQRAKLVVIGQVLFFLGVVLLIPQYGLRGVALAQVAQSIFYLIFGWVFMYRTMTGLPFLPYAWKKDIFKEMFLYGAQLQCSSIAMMLFDPLTKVFLSKFGGITSVAYYEMASQFVNKMRTLVVAANQVLIPVAAGLNESDPSMLKKIYYVNIRLIIFLIVPLYALIIAWSPVLSKIWIGQFNKQFVVYVVLLALAWGGSTLNIPAYFINNGTGRVTWNTLSHLLTGVLNVLLGYMLGLFWGPGGVVVGASISLLLGAVVVIYCFHNEQEIALNIMLPKESGVLLVSGVVASLSGCYIYQLMNSDNNMTGAVVSLLVPALILIPSVWIHPMRDAIQSRIQKK